MSPASPGPGGAPAGRSRPYDAAALRTDAWNQLALNAEWLREARRAGQRDDEPRRRLAAGLSTLSALELHYAFPGRRRVAELQRLFDRRDDEELARRASRIVRLLVSEAYRTRLGRLDDWIEEQEGDEPDHADAPARVRPYFEVLVVDEMDAEEEREWRAAMNAVRRDEDEFVYEILVVPSYADAIIAGLCNPTIQACVLRYNFPYDSANRHDALARYLDLAPPGPAREQYGLDRSLTLGATLRRLRPELDLFLITDFPVEEVAGRLGRAFRRAFYRLDTHSELHLSILKGVRARYETPFFDALRRYAQRPTGVFHALPVARGKSVSASHWIRALEQFYGRNIFMAETSATGGGLDSLLQPHGPIKKAQDNAARAFGARRSYFVTNGTSTANKIVVQALVRPGDIVMLSHDCHKSHHYALILAGACPLYLDSYPLHEHTMCGAVPLRDMKRRLLEMERAGKLDKVRMLLLTNCTFDGVTYNPERVMAEILAIKPDMVFVWDEAWFAFARFSPTLRRRTAMEAAQRLRETYRSDDYRERYEKWRADFDARRAASPADDSWLDGPLMADPERVRVRVYATHSTHKTLTAFRQGSMIHVHDEEFEQKAAEAFDEAFMTHTSTSPNYQIVASLDTGRRQVELEGYELVQKSIGLAMALRERIYEHPLIRRYFSVLRPADMIPAQFRSSGIEFYYDPDKGWARMEQAWRDDEFCLDPTRITVHIGLTGMAGDALRALLMDEHDIQINKTSRNTVLFNTSIGMSRGDVAHLVEALAKIAGDLDENLATQSEIEGTLRRGRVDSLTRDLPPLPDFSRVHDAFRPDPGSTTPEGDMRAAFFLAYDETACEHLKIDGPLQNAMAGGRELVSASFVTPYPPGYPILAPGQVITPEILWCLRAVDVREIHGYKPGYGLRVFTQTALDRALDRALAARATALRKDPAPRVDKPDSSDKPDKPEKVADKPAPKAAAGASAPA